MGYLNFPPLVEPCFMDTDKLYDSLSCSEFFKKLKRDLKKNVSRLAIFTGLKSFQCLGKSLAISEHL